MNEVDFTGPVAGIDEATSPLYLPQGAVSELIDLVLDAPGLSGTPVRRGNWENFSAPPFTTILGLAAIPDGEGNNYLVAFSETSVALSKGGAGEWEIVTSGLEGSGACGTFPAGDGRNVLFSGMSAVVIGGSNLTETSPFGIAAPEINGAPGVVAVQHDSGGSIGPGWYNYVLVYESEQGDSSMVSMPFTAYRLASTGSTGFSGTSNKVVITGLPVPDDTRVIRKRLYRTRGVIASTVSPSPFIYYELAVLAPEETGYTDTKHDDELSTWKTARFTLPPAAGAWCFNKGRLFAAGLKLPEVNFFAPPYSSDGVSGRVFSGTATIEGGEIWNASDYCYRLVFVDENGTESAFIETPVITTPGEEYENFAAVTLNYIPYLPSTEGLRIREKRLYRTKKDGTVFYRHPVKLALNQLAFTDTLADTGLMIEEMNTSPEETTYPATLAFSEPGRHFTFPPESIISLPGGTTDPIMSIHDDGDGVLLLTRGAIHKLYTSGDPVTWRIVTLYTTTGQQLVGGVLSSPAGVIFFDRGKFHILSSGALRNIGDSIGITLTRVKAFMQPARFAERKWCCFPVVLDDDSKLLLIFDEKTGGWYKFSHPGLGGVVALPACPLVVACCELPGEVNNLEGMLLSWGGRSVVKYEPEGVGPDIIGESDSEVVAFLRTREYTTTGMGVQRLRKLRLYLQALPGEVEVKLETGNGDISFTRLISEPGESIIIEPVPSAANDIAHCRRASVSVGGTGIGAIKGIKLEKRRVRD